MGASMIGSDVLVQVTAARRRVLYRFCVSERLVPRNWVHSIYALAAGTSRPPISIANDESSTADAQELRHSRRGEGAAN
jgi:hypothetical protein